MGGEVLESFRSALQEMPLIASVQAEEGSALDSPEILARMAQESVDRGVRILRCQGVANIEAIKKQTGTVIIGLIKRHYPDSAVYITPTFADVDELLGTACEVIALDATTRLRPASEDLVSLIERAHRAGRLVCADCDTVESAERARAAGVDMIATTLAGYTEHSVMTTGPDLGFLRAAVHAASGVPLIAEGRYSKESEVLTALRIGASGVVIGGAINEPSKNTERFAEVCRPSSGDVAAFDLGGTWLRFGLFSADWKLKERTQIATPPSSAERFAWMKNQIQAHEASAIGVSSGGTIGPASGEVTEAKDMIPGHVGARFCPETLGGQVLALNDGLASAWGHACLAEAAGRRVATIALGTGVGCGLVDGQRLSMGGEGEYPRLNDLDAESGKTFEELLGGATLLGEEERAKVLARLIDLVRAIWMPELIYVCGSAAPSNLGDHALRSPFGADAGLYGAAALALFPPNGFRPR